MFSETIIKQRYCAQGETAWEHVVSRVVNAVFSAVSAPESLKTSVSQLMLAKKFIPGGRILRNAGLPLHQLSNCFLFSAEDSREGWGDLARKSMITLMTGGGVGVYYGNIRASGAYLKKTQGVASGPLPLISAINELGRGAKAGGVRRAALYASLPWSHPDVFSFIHMKDWPDYLRGAKALDMDVQAPCDLTNISVSLDRRFFRAYEDPGNRLHGQACDVYAQVCQSMCTTGEPGFQIDMDSQILRNA